MTSKVIFGLMALLLLVGCSEWVQETTLNDRYDPRMHYCHGWTYYGDTEMVVCTLWDYKQCVNPEDVASPLPNITLEELEFVNEDYMSAAAPFYLHGCYLYTDPYGRWGNGSQIQEWRCKACPAVSE